MKNLFKTLSLRKVLVPKTDAELPLWTTIERRWHKYSKDRGQRWILGLFCSIKFLTESCDRHTKKTKPFEQVFIRTKRFIPRFFFYGRTSKIFLFVIRTAWPFGKLRCSLKISRHAGRGGAVSDYGSEWWSPAAVEIGGVRYQTKGKVTSVKGVDSR